MWRTLGEIHVTHKILVDILKEITSTALVQVQVHVAYVWDENIYMYFGNVNWIKLARDNTHETAEWLSFTICKRKEFLDALSHY
jgi:hypothetical protein